MLERECAILNKTSEVQLMRKSKLHNTILVNTFKVHNLVWKDNKKEKEVLIKTNFH